MAITLRQTKGSALTYAELDANFTTITGGTLAQFATTTSAQLAGVISDETGTGPLVFGTSPTLTSPVITGGSINNTPIGATTPSTGAFTTLSASSNVTLSGGTANGVPYLNGSKVLTSGAALVFDGGNLGIGTTPSAKLTAYEPAANAIRMIQDHGTAAAYGMEFYTLRSASPYIVASITASHGSGYTNPYININVADTSRTLQTRVIIDASGNLGFGVTPSAWDGGFKAIESTGTGIGSNSTGSTYYLQNAYYSGASFIYRTTAAASYYQQVAGSHTWYIAPSGTAGTAITFTQSMVLDASSNLSVAGNITAVTGYFGSHATYKNSITHNAGTGSTLYNDTEPGTGVHIFQSGGVEQARTSPTGLAATGAVTATTTIKTGGYTVATLPVGAVGDRAYVTDAVAPTYLGALTGGGTVECPVFRKSTGWVSA